MKYYIITGIVIAVFLLLWFTRNVNAQVIDSPTEAQNTVTSTIADGNGCVVSQEDHEVGEDLMPLQKVVCEK